LGPNLCGGQLSVKERRQRLESQIATGIGRGSKRPNLLAELSRGGHKFEGEKLDQTITDGSDAEGHKVTHAWCETLGN